jgi:hypothetical protein
MGAGGIRRERKIHHIGRREHRAEGKDSDEAFAATTAARITSEILRFTQDDSC